LDLNQGPISYEPTALTTELCPRVSDLTDRSIADTKQEIYNIPAVKLMPIHIKNHQKKLTDFAQRFRDIRFLGQLVFVAIVLLVSWSGIKTIQTNYVLQKQISGLKQQRDLQQLTNNNLKLQDEYYKSDQYLELSARQNFGLATAGEKELIVPEKVALKYTTSPINKQEATTAISAKRNNPQAWFDFFMHRQ
jgi:cell division protein FtsB